MTKREIKLDKRNRRLYDQSIKQIFRNKYVLAYLLKAVMEEYKDLSIEQIISCIEAHIKDGRSTDQIFGARNEFNDEKKSTLLQDITFFAKFFGSEREIDALINVELQNYNDSKLRQFKRTLMHGCEMIAFQRGTLVVHSQYENLRKVVTIWVFLDPSKKAGNKTLHFPKEVEYSEEEKSLMDQKVSENLEAIMVYCGQGSEITFFELVEVLLFSGYSDEEIIGILRERFGIKSEILKKEISDMCDVGAIVIKRRVREAKIQAMEEGRAEGIAQGLAEGRAEGRRESLAATIKKMMSVLNYSFEQALEFLNVNQEDRIYLKNLML